MAGNAFNVEISCKLILEGISCKYQIINKVMKDIINLFNNRTNKSNHEIFYSKKSISNKRFDDIFEDIVDLLE